MEKKVKMRSKKAIEKFLADLKSPDYCIRQTVYEYAATVDTLEWVLGLREYPPLAGRRG